MKRHFLASGAIHVKDRGAREARVFLKQTKRLAVLVKRSQKPRVLFSREANHAQFRNHYRPTEDRCDGKKSENDFPCDRRVIERKQQTAAGRYDFRNEHSRVTWISNNALLRKRHLSFRPERSGTEEWSGWESRDIDGRPQADRPGTERSKSRRTWRT